MTDDMKIQLAADLIRAEMFKRGSHVSDADALSIARELHRIWRTRLARADVRPGYVAQRMRERYEQ